VTFTIRVHFTQPQSQTINGRMARIKLSRVLYTVSQKLKNDAALACYNFDVHQPILIIFRRNVARKVIIEWYFIFPPHLTSASALPGETESQKLRVFTSMINVFLTTNTQNNIHSITWSQLYHPSFSQMGTDCCQIYEM